MKQTGTNLQLSATDLANFLGCRHRTALDMAVAQGMRDRPPRVEDPLLKLLQDRGATHEQEYVSWLTDGGANVVDLSSIESITSTDALVTATLEAIKRGVQVIVQGGLSDGRWFGKPDILRRVEARDGSSRWSYEVYDTKLSRTTKAGAVLQLGLYSEMLAQAQGRAPERFYIVTPRMPPAARRQKRRPRRSSDRIR